MDKNHFELTKGNAGKEYVAEITKWIDRWYNKTRKREIAFDVIMCMPHLLLQKTTKKSKRKEDKIVLERRLEMRKNGEIAELLNECQTLQNKLPTNSARTDDIADVAKRFKNCMIMGNMNGALRLLESDAAVGVLPINDETKNLLLQKHPKAEPKFVEALLQGPVK